MLRTLMPVLRVKLKTLLDMLLVWLSVSPACCLTVFCQIVLDCSQCTLRRIN